MGTGPKAAIAVVVVVVLVGGGLPVLAGLKKGGWNERSLTGTIWRGEEQGIEMLLTFRDKGVLAIKIPNLERLIEDQLAQLPPEQARAMRGQMMAALGDGIMTGSWRVDGQRIFMRGPSGTPGMDQGRDRLD